MTNYLMPVCRASTEPNPFPVVVGGSGVFLELDNGQRVIDASSMGMSATLGHRHPDLVTAVKTAADTPFANEYYVTPERKRAAETILTTGFAGEDWAGGIRFTTSASDANDLAILLAQTLTGRSPFASRERAYLGAIGYARRASGHPLLHGGLASKDGGVRLPPDQGMPARHFEDPRCGLWPAEEECDASGCSHLAPVTAAADGAAAVIDAYGSVGVYPSPAFHDGLAKVARDAGALWIDDEAISGMGRTGRWFAFQRGTERPDIVVLGKGAVGGGAPGGAIIVSNQILENIADERWQSVSSFYAHHTTTAAMETCFAVVEREGLVQRAREVGPIVAERMNELKDRHDAVTRVAGEGLLWTLEMGVAEQHDPTRWLGDGSQPSIASRVGKEALARGVLLSLSNAAAVRIAPPLISSDAELNQIFDIVDQSLQAVGPLVEELIAG